MPRFRVEVVAIALLLTYAAAGEAALYPAAVTGVVRDAQGVPQMGAVVQLVATGAGGARTAYTDMQGRYLIVDLLPGVYRMRATAALYVPAMRDNLRLRGGAQAVVNLTLGALFDASSWLPAERRRADEPSDDWKWTLRSAANRPILRMVDDGTMVMVSSSATETVKPSIHVRGGATSGDGGFGNGGMHHVISMDRGLDDGSGVLARVDVGSGGAVPGVGPSTELDAGYQRELGFAGASRVVVGFQSHPEMLGPGGEQGLQATRVVSAQRTKIADVLDVEYGSEVIAVHTVGYAIAAEPFLRVVAHPSENWSVGYRMATSREVQGYGALDGLDTSIPVAAMSGGKLRMEAGRHQEISVARNMGRGKIEASLYSDVLDRTAVAGGGELGAADLNGAATPLGLLADASTESFRLMGEGFSTRGLNVTMTEPITSSLWVAAAFSTGDGLVRAGVDAANLAETARGLHPEAAQSATLAVKGRVLHTGTRVRAAYRWQPSRLVTAVDSYAAFSDQGYLSFYIGQRLRWGRMLPPGLDAVVDVTNLLAQGYQPFVSSDGRMLFLAQAPRTIQAGLSFSF